MKRLLSIVTAAVAASVGASALASDVGAEHAGQGQPLQARHEVQHVEGGRLRPAPAQDLPVAHVGGHHDRSAVMRVAERLA